STGNVGVTTDHGDGRYTATFTGVLAGTATTISATIAAVPVTSTPPTITVTPGNVSLTTSTLSGSSGTVASGNAVTLTLRAKDAAGNNLFGGGLVVAFNASVGTGISTGTIGSVTDHADGTYTASFTGVTAGTATTMHATIAGTLISATAPVTVTAGNPVPSASVFWASASGGGSVTPDNSVTDAAGRATTVRTLGPGAGPQT